MPKFEKFWTIVKRPDQDYLNNHNTGRSKAYSTKEQAIERAKECFVYDASIKYYYIMEVIAVVELASPPIKVTEIYRKEGAPE